MPKLDDELARLGTTLRALAAQRMSETRARPGEAQRRWSPRVAAAVSAALVLLAGIPLFFLWRSQETAPPSTTKPPSSSVPSTIAEPEHPLGVTLAAPVASGTILIASSEAVLDETDEVVLELPGADLVTGDGRGGVLVEKEGRIWWLRPDGSLPVLVAEGTGTQEDNEHLTVELHAGMVLDGDRHAIFVKSRHSGDSTYPQVILTNLDDEIERVFLEPPVGEGGVTRVSVGRDLVAVSIATDGGQAVILKDLDATDDDPGEALTEIDMSSEYLGPAILTPDGSTLIYLDSSPAPGEEGEEATDLVWIDLATREELRREAMPVAQDWNGWRWAWLDADNERVMAADLQPLPWGYGYGTALIFGPGSQQSGIPGVGGRFTIIR